MVFWELLLGLLDIAIQKNIYFNIHWDTFSNSSEKKYRGLKGFGDWIKLNGLLLSPQQNLIIAKFLQDCFPLVSFNKQLNNKQEWIKINGFCYLSGLSYHFVVKLLNVCGKYNIKDFKRNILIR